MKEVPTSAYGGVSAGPVDAIGNVLVVMTPEGERRRRDPRHQRPAESRCGSLPRRRTRRTSGSSTGTTSSCIGLKSCDVLIEPEEHRHGRPIGSLPTEGSEYMSLQDDYMFLGHVRTEIGGTPGASKITVADPRSMKVTSRIWGRLTSDKNDDQFPSRIGNLLVLGDDQSPYAGWVIAVHQAEPDSKAARDRHGHPRQRRDRCQHQVPDRRHVLGQHRARDREQRELHRPSRGRAAAAGQIRRADERR